MGAPDRRRTDHGDALHFEATAIALVLAAVAVLTALFVLVPPAPPVPQALTLSAAPGSAPFPLAPRFWGANVGLNVPASTALAQAVASTPIALIRWPGGAAGDELNYTTGNLTNATGAVFPAAMSLPAFVAWCRSLNCSALLELPGEIDDPATAAYYVAFTERTLGFRPVLWEVGNEPALWTHFGRPWSTWSSSPPANATPASYAVLLQSYLSAIHRVDPSAQVLGLPGVGTGGYGESNWISASLALNAPNVSGIGIHVYPAGTTTLQPATASAFFANVSGSRSLAARVVADRATIAAADPADPNLPLVISELGTGNNPGGPSPFLQGYDEVPFVASELLSAMGLNVSQVDLTQVQTPQAGAWLDANGSTHPLFSFYRAWAPELGPIVVPSVASDPVPTFFWVVTENGTTGPTTVLVVNANLTVPVTLGLAPLGFAGSVAVQEWTWRPGSDAGTYGTGTAGSGTWSVPPLGLAMFRIAGPPHAVVAGGASTTSANATSIATAEARWRWEICSTFTPMGTSSPWAAAAVRTSW